MFEIKNEVIVELNEKKSKFITRSVKVSSEEEVKEILSHIKNAEKGANHNCYAWRILKENGQIYIKRSDDGEPTGTAGAPMLAQLIGENLVNVLVVTTRYFGGIKLGTGGLASVYKRGVSESIKKSGKVKYEKKKVITISAHISKSDHLLSLLSKRNIKILNKYFDHEIKVEIEISEDILDMVENISKQVSGKIIF